jgi:hypothetical protein
MNREDIIRMAREAGFHAPEGRTYILSPTIHPDDDLSEYLERFAALVASAERGEIAQMIEDAPALMEFAQNDQGGCLMCGFTPKLAANSIRARGQA